MTLLIIVVAVVVAGIVLLRVLGTRRTVAEVRQRLAGTGAYDHETVGAEDRQQALQRLASWGSFQDSKQYVAELVPAAGGSGSDGGGEPIAVRIEGATVAYIAANETAPLNAVLEGRAHSCGALVYFAPDYSGEQALNVKLDLAWPPQRG